MNWQKKHKWNIIPSLCVWFIFWRQARWWYHQTATVKYTQSYALSSSLVLYGVLYGTLSNKEILNRTFKGSEGGAIEACSEAVICSLHHHFVKHLISIPHMWPSTMSNFHPASSSALMKPFHPSHPFSSFLAFLLHSCMWCVCASDLYRAEEGLFQIHAALRLNNHRVCSKCLCVFRGNKITHSQLRISECASRIFLFHLLAKTNTILHSVNPSPTFTEDSASFIN